MEMINVGPDEMGLEYDLEKIKHQPYTHFVYWYKRGSYDGSGLGAGVRPDGKIDQYNLGHCSCYGPLNSGSPDSTHELVEFLSLGKTCDVSGKLRSQKDYDFLRWHMVVPKIAELTKGLLA